MLPVLPAGCDAHRVTIVEGGQRVLLIQRQRRLVILQFDQVSQLGQLVATTLPVVIKANLGNVLLNRLLLEVLKFPKRRLKETLSSHRSAMSLAVKRSWPMT